MTPPTGNIGMKMVLTRNSRWRRGRAREATFSATRGRRGGWSSNLPRFHFQPGTEHLQDPFQVCRQQPGPNPCSTINTIITIIA